jgi:aminoglycoside 3'-phosphotransferase I
MPAVPFNQYLPKRKQLLQSEGMQSPVPVPPCLEVAIQGYCWKRVTEGESGGAVYRLARRNRPTLYLKYGVGPIADDILAEMVRLRWLSSRIPVPDVLHFFYSSQKAWLLTSAVAGWSAYECLRVELTDRNRIVTALAEFLRLFHSAPVDACPFRSDHAVRMADAWRRLEKGQVDESDFDTDHKGWTAEQVWAQMAGWLPLPFRQVVTHGDFSLGNILLEDGRVTGCIDVGRAGTADPYQDLSILWQNLAEFGGDLQSLLFRVYGIAAPDERKVRFHLCLDEFF